jgi:hypothetical protein
MLTQNALFRDIGDAVNEFDLSIGTREDNPRLPLQLFADRSVIGPGGPPPRYP